MTIEHSRYTLYFAAYGICALIMALDSKSANSLLEKPLVRWAFAAVMLFTWGMLVRVFNAPAGIEDYLFFRTFVLQVNAIGFVLCCTMIFDDPDVLQITKCAVAVATLVGVVLNIYDFMFPGFFSYYPGRAAGLYVDPNISGISLVFGCVIGLSAIRRPWWQEAFVLVSFIGVLVTFSREAILAFGCVMVCGNLAGRWRLRRMAVACGVGVALFVAFNMANNLLSEKLASSDNWSRLTSSSDPSARVRVNLAEQTLEAFEEAPLLGQGFGTTSFWDQGRIGSHNLLSESSRGPWDHRHLSDTDAAIEYRPQILGLLRLCSCLSGVLPILPQCFRRSRGFNQSRDRSKRSLPSPRCIRSEAQIAGLRTDLTPSKFTCARRIMTFRIDAPAG